MFPSFSKKIPKVLVICLSSIILGVVFSYGFYLVNAAWSDAISNPPTCPAGSPGCDPPLNVSSMGQYKAGGLILNTGGAAIGLIVQNGNVGIGTTNPMAKLDVAGNIIASSPTASNHVATKGYVDAQSGGGSEGIYSLTANNGMYNNKIPSLTPATAYTEVCFKETSGSYSGDITPAMTSNTSPSPYNTSASAEYESKDENRAYKAFDHDSNTRWQAGVGGNTWLKFDFGGGAAVTKYTLYCQTDCALAPRSWTLQGSNDNSNYTDLHSQTNYTWSNNQTLTYTFSNFTPFRYYRLSMYNIVYNTLLNEVEFMTGGVSYPSIDVHNANESTSGGNCVPGDVGYIIERNERAADYWEFAKSKCLQNNMRLPEPFEFKLACKNSVGWGLNNMSVIREWASNFSLPITVPSGVDGVGAAILGGGDCGVASIGWVASNQVVYGESAYAFRCAR